MKANAVRNLADSIAVKEKWPMRLSITVVCIYLLAMASASLAIAKSKSDRFYLPQSDQPFEGEVETRIGTLEFDNRYPSKESMQAILDSMDFHGATQAYLW